MEIKHPLFTDDGEWLPGHNESEGGGPEIRRGFYDQIFAIWRRANEGGADDHICPRGVSKRSSVSPLRLWTSCRLGETGRAATRSLCTRR